VALAGGRRRAADDRERERRSATSEAAGLRTDVDRLRRALDMLPQAVLVAGPNGEILERNRAASSVVGDRAGDALVAEEIRAAARAALEGRAVRKTVELFGPPRRTLELSAAPFDDGALVEVEDVTERARVDAVRTDFVANISHELKTPIGAIALLAETAADETDPELLGRLALRMQAEAHRVGRMIDDLLELSRIELGEPPLSEPVSVGQLAAEAAERVRSRAESRGIGIVVHEPAGRLSAMGDRRQLVSALANLLDNGVKYSDPGSKVEVSAIADGAWLDLVVTDHGIGIPPRDLDRIFERFYRVDRARSRETGGTGLGLAIVRHVAANHGGSVTVRSEEGAGSTFVLRVPASESATTAERAG
jgi:two-component system sensor histidine kinase SenX3